MTPATHAPAPDRNARALTAALGRYVAFVLPRARVELSAWRRRAGQIPDPVLRAQALDTQRDERFNAWGAALFAVLPPTCSLLTLVRILVAYQTMYDYLDTLTEKPVPNQLADSGRLHRALTCALAPGARLGGFYDLHPRQQDGGYLAALVATCQAGCAVLPAFASIAAAARTSALRSAQVQGLNHLPQQQRASALRAWWSDAQPRDTSLEWWEHAAGACSTLDMHTLLAAAADPTTTRLDVEAIVRYATVLCALNCVLDSLTDLPVDSRAGDHSYIAYYRSPRHLASRLGFLAGRSVLLRRQLRNDRRHLAILQAMVSLYLSRPEARTAQARPAALAVTNAIPVPLKPLLGARRLLRSIRSLARQRPLPFHA
jgi:tetraprenyl-beta-curcumene synthase